jgi:4-amino-4-deoxy-L-arabinose transferase-like glycosyltransferase
MVFKALQVRSRLLLVVCSIICAIVVAGRLSPNSFSGYDLQHVIDGDFSSDGWIGENVTIEVPGFASLVNSIELRFNPARPGATEAGRVAISVCNQAAREFVLESDAPIRISVPPGCTPIRASVRSLNFFTPLLEKNPRRLGAQLLGVSVVSPVGPPVVALDILCIVAVLLVAIALLTEFVASRAGIPGIPLGFAAVGIITGIISLTNVPGDKLEPVAIVMIGVLAGMALYSFARGQSAFRESEGGGAVLLAVSLVVGSALRLYGIRFGLPSNFHPDEVPKVNAIMRMVEQNSLDPQYFLHPSLLLYSTYAMNTFLQAIGIVDGTFRDTAFLAGRLVSTTAGVLSIALTYSIGKRLFSREAGGIAACLLAVFPLHITCSRYLKEDALLTFVILSCVLVTIIAVQSKRPWLLLVAGLLAGCTAGTKYSGILMAMVPASAPWIVSRRLKPDIQWLPWAIAAVVVAPFGFIATTPYALLNSAKFIKDFQTESRHMQTGHTVSITAWSQLWMYHFWRSIWPGITGLVSACAMLAVGFLMRRARLEDLVVVGMIVLFYLPAEYVKAKPAPQPERYILPCLPFLALAVGELLACLRAHRSGMLRNVVPLAVLCLVVVPGVRSMQLAKDLPNDTRDQLATWMKTNLPEGAKVLMDWKPYCPNFHGEYFQVEHIPRARIIPGLDVQNLRTSGAHYLVLSSLYYNRYFSQPESQAVLRQRFREVFQRVPVIKQFEAPSGTYGFHNPTLTLFSLNEDDFKRLDDERLQKLRGEIQSTTNELRARAKW